MKYILATLMFLSFCSCFAKEIKNIEFTQIDLRKRTTFSINIPGVSLRLRPSVAYRYKVKSTKKKTKNERQEKK